MCDVLFFPCVLPNNSQNAFYVNGLLFTAHVMLMLLKQSITVKSFCSKFASVLLETPFQGIFWS